MLFPMLFRLLTGSALLFAITLSWVQLGLHVTWRNHYALDAEVRRGRLEPRDLGRLQPVLDQQPITGCWVLRQGAVVTLYLYAVNLRALDVGVNPFDPADDAQLTAQRERTQRVIEHALACSPLNGDFWLSLAVISRSLGKDPARIAQYLRLSQRHAPHEGWIRDRRERLF